MRKYLLVISFILFTHFAPAQSIDLEDYSINTFQTDFKKINNTAAFWNEAPPWVIKGESYQYIFTTHFSSMWSSSVSIGKPKDDILHVGSWQGTDPNWIVSSSHWWGKFYDPSFLQSPGYMHQSQWENYHWRRNYNGVFSAHVVNDKTTEQQILFAISHGENKNERIGAYFYQNTVRPDFKINKDDPTTYSGGVPYQDCWDAYFGFLNGNWSTYGKDNNWGNVYLHDIGPIAWPAAGYLNQDGTQASKGLRHPSSIIDGNYLYIFVVDASHHGKGGVKLIRSHVNELQNTSKYETWSKSGWIPALPQGFTKERAADFFKRKGPNNSRVFALDRNTIRFSVAKIIDTDEFIGVEEYIMGRGDHTIKAAFRFSKDLIHWSDRVPFYAADDWGSSTFRYPIFLNRDGTSNTEIDIEEFYVLGASGDGSITKMHFNLDQPIFPTEGSRPNGVSPITFSGNRVNITGDAGFTVSPVPASLTVDLKFSLETTSNVKVNLYDARGVKVKTLLDDVLQPQILTKTFDISQLQHGLFVLELIQNDKRFFKKIIKI
ncbi:MAG: T9SS type A sorting domain-containing protein [Nitrospirota bacterium]